MASRIRASAMVNPRSRSLVRLRRPGARELGESVATNVVLAAIGAVTGILAARLLGPDGRGHLAAIRTPALIVAGLAMLGQTDAMVFHVRRADRDRRSVICTAATLAACSTALAGGIAALVIPFLLDDVPRSVVRLSRIWMLVPVLTALTGIPVMAFRAIGRERTWNALRIAPGVLWLGALILSFAAPADSRLATILVAYLASMALYAVTAWRRLGREIGASLRPRLDGWRPLLTYGAPLSIAALPQVANTHLDQLILIPLVSSRELGHYVAAVAFSALGAPIVSGFGIVLFPRLSARRDRLAQRQTVRSHLLPAAVVAAGGAVIGVIVAPALLPALFGEDFRGAVGVSRVLLPAGALLALSDVVKAALLGLGSTSTVLAGDVAGLFVNIVALVVLVPTAGITGAALASLVAYAIVLVVRSLAVRRILRSPAAAGEPPVGVT